MTARTPSGYLLPPAVDIPRSAFDPAANVKAAMEYIRRRYGLSTNSWETWTAYKRRVEEEKMGRAITMEAPANPYRRGGGRAFGTAMSAGAAGEMVNVALDTPAPMGAPGLTASDLDGIARRHWREGYRAGEQAKDRDVQEALAGRADAFDEGYVAGRVERTQGLAGDFATRLLGIHFELQAIENGPKNRREEGLKRVREYLNDTMAFADSIRHSETNAAMEVAETGDGVLRRVT